MQVGTAVVDEIHRRTGKKKKKEKKENIWDILLWAVICWGDSNDKNSFASRKQ